MVNPYLRPESSFPGKPSVKTPRSTVATGQSGQIPQMTCQFPFESLRKKLLTVKGSGCVALGHPVTSAKKWLLEEDDRSMADGGFGTAPALLLLQSTGASDQ